MKIQWNKVTWYSKMAALILFVALPFIGFYLGAEIGEKVGELNILMRNNFSALSANGLPEYYTNPAEWQTDRNDNGGFSIAYPIDFDAQDSYSTVPTTEWEFDNAAQTSGLLSFMLTVPRAFEPQSNFADAKLTIGESRTVQAIARCLTPGASEGPEMATSSVMINGISFTKFTSGGAGAGNYYETTSYRTLHAGQCYAIDYTIHSTQIGNYPSEYNLKPFDKSKIITLLENIVHTFKFL